VTATAETETRELPSGRSVVLRLDGREEIEVRSPTGDVEVRIVLTESGPRVQLHAAQLELVSPEAIEVRCKRFAVDTSEGTELRSAGEIQVHAEQDVDVKGKLVKLNC
jgi:hypothetical protein